MWCFIYEDDHQLEMESVDVSIAHNIAGSKLELVSGYMSVH